MPLTPEQVAHIASLAKLSFSDEEKVQMAKELDAVLTYVEKLNELDTENVEPLSHTSELTNVMRSDEIKSSLPPDEAVDNAPDKQGSFFKVPKVIQ